MSDEHVNTPTEFVNAGFTCKRTDDGAGWLLTSNLTYAGEPDWQGFNTANDMVAWLAAAFNGWTNYGKPYRPNALDAPETPV